jgi:hypothetical protein
MLQSPELGASLEPLFYSKSIEVEAAKAYFSKPEPEPQVKLFDSAILLVSF